jgi:hypothetical protein
VPLVEHTPNSIPLAERILNGTLGCAIIAYAGCGLSADDLVFKTKGARTPTHFHGEACIWAFIAMVFVASAMILTVLDHYDRRPTEHYYRFGTRALMLLGAALLIIAHFRPTVT